MESNGITVKHKLQNMKKYFIIDTDEEVKIGDVIEFTFVKEGNNGKPIIKVHRYKFSEALIPLLLDEKVIEIREENTEEETKKEPLIDFSKDDDPNDKKTNDEKENDEDIDEDIDEFMEALTDTLETMGTCIKNLEAKVDNFNERLETLEDQLQENNDEDSSIYEFLIGFGL